MDISFFVELLNQASDLVRDMTIEDWARILQVLSWNKLELKKGDVTAYHLERVRCGAEGACNGGTGHGHYW